MTAPPQDHLPTLEELDRDGAIREGAAAAEVAATDTSRASFLRRGALLMGGGLAIGSLGLGRAIAQGGLPKGDVEILNYALTLEFLEAAFYKEAVESGRLEGEALIFAQVVAQHEAEHVTALQGVLGSKAVKSPRFDFKGTTRGSKFLPTAQVLEDTGVAAYAGQGPRVKTPAVLESAGAILAVEARHAAWVRDIRGGGKGINPAPAAFEEAKDMKTILDAVKGTGFIQS